MMVGVGEGGAGCGCGAGGRLSRRGLLAAAALPAGGGLVEPRLRLRPAPGEGSRVALTLDACMGGFDMRVMEALVALAVPATIFVTGLWIRQNPAGVAFLRAQAGLLGLGNHGARHVPAVVGGAVFGIAGARDLAAVQAEVEGGGQAIAEAFGAMPRWFRGATGRYGPGVVAAIEGWGFAVAGYSLNGDFGASLPAAGVAARVAAAGDGAVVIGHVNQPGRASGAGLVAGVRGLQARGVRFVRLDQLAPGETLAG